MFGAVDRFRHGRSYRGCGSKPISTFRISEFQIFCLLTGSCLSTLKDGDGAEFRYESTDYKRLLKATVEIVIGGNMKALKWIGVICLVPVVLVAGSYIRNKMVGPVGWATEDVEKALRMKMKDPDSMVIRSSYVVERKTEFGLEISICGFVDGRNGFGAYSGPVRFASKSFSNRQLGVFETSMVKLENPLEATQSRESNMLSAFEEIYWNKYCVDATHPALTVGSN